MRIIISKNSFLPKATPSSVSRLSFEISGAINLSWKITGIYDEYGTGVSLCSISESEFEQDKKTDPIRNLKKVFKFILLR